MHVTSVLALEVMWPSFWRLQERKRQALPRVVLWLLQRTQLRHVPGSLPALGFPLRPLQDMLCNLSSG